MKVSYNWLKSYVDFDLSPEELGRALTARGVVVETITSANPGMKGVVVGKVVAMERHPNADTLWVCQVDVGGGNVLQILTGAQNVSVGDLVPAAIPGSEIPGKTMAVANLRGLDSHGMLCSPDEIGIDEGHEGILILPPDSEIEVGMDAAEVLGMDDHILELDLTANYAQHCLSMVGVAQEVAAILGNPVEWPETYTEDEVNTSAEKMIGLEIRDVDLCARYVARIIRGVKVGPSPAWLQAKLRAAGMRPINNIVDISNFVMLELGQPLHTFDYQKIGGKQIIVRRAGEGEIIRTLDGQERKLNPDILVIADAEHPVAIAGVMGGEDSEVTAETVDILIESAAFNNINNRRTSLKLNLQSEASKRFTKGVDPSGCLRAADRAAMLIAELAGGRVVQGHVDLYPVPTVPPVHIVRTARVNELLGLELSLDRMTDHLERLGMVVLLPEDLATDLVAGKPEAEEAEGEDLGGRPVWTAMHQVSPVPQDADAYRQWADSAWTRLEQAAEQLESLGEHEAMVVVVPTRRLDLFYGEVDLVEEIGRSEGFDQIPTVLPELASYRGGRTPLAEATLKARQVLAGAGLTEIITLSLLHPKVYDALRLPAESPLRQHLALANPLYEDRSTLRTTMLPSLLDAMSYNANRQARDLALFEVGHVFWPQQGEPLPLEPKMLSIGLMGNQAVTGWNSPEQPADFFTLKGIIEHLLHEMLIRDWSVERGDHPALHPGRQAKLLVGGQAVGHFGELHPAVQEAWDLPSRAYVAELDFEALAAAGAALRDYRPVPKYPAVTRDVAMIVGLEVPAANLAEAIRTAGGTLVEDVALFDLYQGEHVRAGARSLAYRITYRSASSTLTDADIEAVHSQVRSALQALGAELRS